jgi:hypothetical protein
MEDIYSGKFAAANRMISYPFSDMAIRYAYYIELIAGPGAPLNSDYIRSVDDMVYANKEDVDILPQRWITFNKLNYRDKQMIIAGLQVINPDGTYGILNVIVDNRPLEEFIQTE